jgi:hypothetical protein
MEKLMSKLFFALCGQELGKKGIELWNIKMFFCNFKGLYGKRSLRTTTACQKKLAMMVNDFCKHFVALKIFIS